MGRKVRGVLWPLVGFLFLVSGCSAFRGPLEPMGTAVYFSPDGGSTEAIVREINRAQYRIWVQAYGFTSAPIAEALIAAHKRGVEVLAVLDKSNETDKYTAATFLNNSGIKTLIDDQHAIAHNKVMVIDNTTLITGSFNFTKAAEERNAENLLILNDIPYLAGAYADNIVLHVQHSQPYQFAGEILQPPVADREQLSRDTRMATTKRPRAAHRVNKTQEAALSAVHKRRKEPKPVQVAMAGRGPIGSEVRANRRSKVYRTFGCRGYDLINPENQIVFASERKAIAAGYRKAEVCQ
jgi:phosphatidylserine/phosphatidylglycerophosphate/cardiolipin synthase-like enzyme